MNGGTANRRCQKIMHLRESADRALRTVLPRAVQVCTFSIAALDETSGDLGVAVASKFLAVGSIVPSVAAAAGAVATQAAANASYGPKGLALMAAGSNAEETVARLTADDPARDQRQVGVVDARGGAAAHTGDACHQWAGHRVGRGYTCQGNLLVGAETVDAMATAFEVTTGELSRRLLSALQSGEAAGGDRRGCQSAAMIVARKDGGYGGLTDVLVDLRVDDHQQPVRELARLLDLHNLFLGASPEEDRLRLDETLTRELQGVLKRNGYYRGDLNGAWSDATKLALDALVSTENPEERVDLALRTIDRPALQYIREKFSD